MTTGAFMPPVVATYEGADPSAPLVVLLHGRGSNEREILDLAAHLPAGPAYVAVRAPITEGGGFAWFANRGIGRPVAESLRRTMDWFTTWLDGAAPAGRPVLLFGFSGGAAFAGGLVLDHPSRYAGAAILYGTLPFDADVPTHPGRLATLPVFVAQGERDQVIPRDLLDRTWSYLLAESGAPTVAHRTPGGHQLDSTTVHEVGEWIAHRLAYVSHYGVAATPTDPAPAWPTLAGGTLPERRGPRPDVSWTIPQQQQTQNSPVDIQEQLFTAMRALPGVEVGPSRISVPGARGLTVSTGSADEQAFLVPGHGEFAHLHPAYDGSLHLALPSDLAADISTKGWGRPHMWAGTRLADGFTLIYGPRDHDELTTVQGIVAASHACATSSDTSVTSQESCRAHRRLA